MNRNTNETLFVTHYVKNITAGFLILTTILSMSSCGKKHSDIDFETANVTEAVSEVADYTEKAELTIDDTAENDASEKSAESTEASVTSVKETKTAETEKTQKSNPPAKTEEPKTQNTEKAQNKITATDNDFKRLEEILNKDGGYISDHNFNYKTASRDDFIDVAQSYGFVPAYYVYFNKNAFSDENLVDMDNDGYDNMTIPVKTFNWILKNVYNYTGKDFSLANDGKKYTIKGENVYFWLPPDEGGLYGEFRLKSYSEKNGVYKIKYDFYAIFDPFVDNPELVYNSTYTVSASLKNVDSIDKGEKIKVWSIYSIEKE